MRKISFIVGIGLVLGVLVFAACDYVSNPYENNNSSTTTTTGNTTGSAPVRKMLVEDYTGHKCDNCPDAARELMKLKETVYKEKMIIVTIHAGGYVSTTPQGGHQFPTDMTCPEGKDYFNTMGIVANPMFTVNRYKYPTGDHQLSKSQIGQGASDNANLAPDFKLEITNQYDAATRKLNTSVKATTLKPVTGSYKMVIMLVEDSVIAEQLDKFNTPNYIPNYVHRDILRGSLNGTWGEQVFSGTINPNEVKTITAPTYNLSTKYNEKHCHIVAYIYDAASSSSKYYEIMQVEEKKIK